MPNTKNFILRCMVLDEMLSDRHHYYDIHDFVEKVNAMLREDSRFELQEDGELSTELRMLAAIRLGITESGKIARFLKCSPTTVYTYRTRLHRAALCGAEEFESRIRTL